ncbi:MAG: DNA repair exonuclease SbcCD ATPase subunit [bacterium]|jgi:DNA repair exonuclease SbcCD ATPase subunit
MHFKNIRVKNFQQFENQEVHIQDLSEQLNIISGSNEAGKSTLLGALKAAFFNRVTGSVVKTYYPYGQTAIVPEVELAFEHKDTTYVLTQNFATTKKGSTELLINGGDKKTGEDARDFLAQFLNYQYMSKGASKLEYQGISGLLWVDQGTTFLPIQVSERSYQSLETTLDHEIQGVVGDKANHLLLEKVKELKKEFYTDKNNNYNLAFKNKIEHLKTLEKEQQIAEEELSRYQNRLDELQTIEEILQRYKKNQQLESAKEEVHIIEKKFIEIQEFQKQIAQYERDLKIANLKQNELDKIWKQRQQLLESHQRQEFHLQQLENSESESKSQLISFENVSGIVNEEFETTQNELRVVSKKIISLQKQQEKQKLNEDLIDLQENYQKAVSAQERLNQLEIKKAQYQVNENSIKNLTNLQNKVDSLHLQIDALSSRIQLKLEPNQTIQFNGQVYSNGDQISFNDTSELKIKGIGTIIIEPAVGESLQSLRHDLNHQQIRLETYLEELSVESLEIAQTQLRHKYDLELKIQSASQEIHIYAKKGLPTLEKKIQQLKLQWNQIPDLEIQNESFDELAEQRNFFEEKSRDLAAQVKEKRSLEQQERTKHQKLKVEKDLLTKQFQENQSQLQEQQNELSDQEWQENNYEAKQEVKKCQNQCDQLFDQLNELNPEVIQLELSQAQQSFEHIQKDYHKNRSRASELKIELNTLGQLELQEKVDSLDRQIYQSTQELQQKEKKAKALKLLHTQLEQSVQQTRKAVTTPIQDKILSYLKILMPESIPEVDEKLTVQTIVRKGKTEDFSRLSLGTREQIAIIVRLAYADLLVEKGLPVSVILDDALVYSDDSRRKRMQTILFKAAQRYQVILLTCHEDQYLNCGGKIIRLKNSTKKIT